MFWRPASNVTDQHARSLAERVARSETVALRTDRGFIVGELRGDEGFVDDFAVDDPSHWSEDGTALLLGAWDELAALGADHMRVVAAAADEPKVAMLRSCEMVLAEQWWVKSVTLGPGERAPGRIEGSGFSGILGPAPPVYDPGAPWCSSTALNRGSTRTWSPLRLRAWGQCSSSFRLRRVTIARPSSNERASRSLPLGTPVVSATTSRSVWKADSARRGPAFGDALMHGCGRDSGARLRLTFSRRVALPVPLSSSPDDRPRRTGWLRAFRREVVRPQGR